jgi:endonuclease YncB( thermonuclease family)
VSFQPFSYRAIAVRVNWATKTLSQDVHDGDSLWLMFDKGDYQYSNANCRLFGINTPEMNDKDVAIREKAAAAREYLKSLIADKELFVKSEKLDKYGRPLVTIWTSAEWFGINPQSVNAQMVKAGHAVSFMGDLS